MSSPWQVAIFVVAFSSTFWYLAECAVFCHRLKNEHPVAWEQMGRPSLFRARQQQPLINLIYEPSRLQPAQSDLLPQARRIRALLLIGVVSMAIMLGTSLFVQV